VLRESLLLYAPSSCRQRGEKREDFCVKSRQSGGKEREKEKEKKEERKTRTCPTSSKLAHMLLIAGVAIVA